MASLSPNSTANQYSRQCKIGCLPLSREEASHFFRLVVRRYERACLTFTSDKSFLDWGDIFNEHVLTTAVLDRPLHHSTILNIKRESYRLKEKSRARLLGSITAHSDKAKESPSIAESLKSTGIAIVHQGTS